VSHFWRRLCESLGTKPRLSTSFHPETDGQTENANAFLKAYLRAYVNYEQDDWALFLPMAEFVANSTVSDSTGVAPFMATKGYIPCDGIGPALPLDKHELTTPARLDRQRADQFADHIKRLSEFLRENLQWAQAKQAEYANDKRVPAQVLRVGDRVMLDARNFKTRRPNASLDYKNRGPFTIIRSINNIAFELDLPPEMGKLHNVFHPWLLHTVDNAPLPGQAQDTDFVDVDVDNEDYTVKSVLSSRISKGKRDLNTHKKGLLEYKVLWEDYPKGPDNPSWEPYTNLIGCPNLVQEFHDYNPNKPPMHPHFADLTTRQHILACVWCDYIDDTENMDCRC
jgi:hypothetical protein